MAEPTNHDLIIALRKEVEEMRAERARAKAEKEKRAREVVPVLNMFSHGNIVDIPAGPQIEANNFKLGIPLINRVEQNAFAGRDNEDANRHLTKFVEIANTIKINGVDDDIVRVRLFPFSLTDAAKEWYDCLSTDKTTNWKDLVVLFLDKYYPPGTILKLKCEIFQFMQGSDEPLYEALARFKTLLSKCPNHGFGIDHQVGILYNGFNEKISSLLDSGANGGFLRKGGVAAMEVIEELATNSRGWSKEKHKAERLDAVKRPCGNETSQELASIRARLEKLEATGKEGNVIKDVKYVQNGGDPNRLHNNNYRPNQGGGSFNNYNGNHPHPNVSHANNHNFVQSPAGFNVSKEKGVEPPTNGEKYEMGIQKILEVMLEDRRNNEARIGFIEERVNNLEQGISTITTAVMNIQTLMDQVHKKLEEDKGKAAARVADINKKWVAKQKKDEGSTSGTKFEDCPTPSGPPHTPRRAATEKAESSTKQELVRHNGIVLPFQPKRKFKLEEQFKQFLNMFCKVHTNIPLVESLQEIPKYAKLLREAVMRKKKPTKADLKLPHHCSEIIQKERAVKQRDPGQFIIRCRIGEGKVDKALCDLGASINIMPLKYYEKLNIGPLKTSDVTIRLADNTAIKTVGMIEDVLVKVDDFIFPADFIILDMKVDKNVPLILGRDFLATCKALIDVVQIKSASQTKFRFQISWGNRRGRRKNNSSIMVVKIGRNREVRTVTNCRKAPEKDPEL
ncbi:uncharacterized protein LOC125220340 [Salvia hispanica]|uniref:uncharacterized protein LOC125220340 n=1 Tax=Salvia hispanica TaxID=49212 RepID=UPI002009B92D|nr:uncharacterized protein LOC125220340 [Salvia hispanica]